MDSKSPYITRMNVILREKRSSGLRGVRLFVPKSEDCSAEDIARGFCIMHEAEKAGKYKDITAEVL